MVMLPIFEKMTDLNICKEWGAIKKDVRYLKKNIIKFI